MALALLLAFIASTVYHFTEHEVYKNRFRLLDHIAVYLVILGTYTPFALVAMPFKLGVTVLVIVWTLSIMAMCFKVQLWRKGIMQEYAKLDTLIYTILGVIALGWLPSFIEYLSLKLRDLGLHRRNRLHDWRYFLSMEIISIQSCYLAHHGNSGCFGSLLFNSYFCDKIKFYFTTNLHF
jgi:predicted membrane channel-forming protein YqfA (hemolysin III family)